MNLNKNISEEKIQSHIKDIDYYGFTKIEQYLSTYEINYFLNLINLQYEKVNFDEKIKYTGVPDRNENDKILYSLYNIDHFFVDLLTSNAIQKIAMHKLNDEYYRFLPSNVPNYILNYYNARSSGDKLDLHIDSHIPFVTKQKTNAIQLAFLLEDSSIDNGCTIVVPGSHKSGNYTDRDFPNSKPITGKAGDLIIWDSRLWHGTTENVSQRSRWAIIATLSQWWCKQSMDIIRNLDNNIYQKCSNVQKQLLGFCSIPPKNEFERNNTKTGYENLKKNVYDYF
jgi:hypothetical protein